MTDRQDWEQQPQYPQQGYGQQYPQGEPWRPQQYQPNAHRQRLDAPQPPYPPQGQPPYPPQGQQGWQQPPQGQPWPQPGYGQPPQQPYAPPPASATRRGTCSPSLAGSSS
jgi:hypothetical protein